MRASLSASLRDTPASHFDRYPKGSIVLCNACAKPIYRLEHGIALGDKAGKSAQMFKPVTMADLSDLATRDDIDAGIRATVKSWTLDERRNHVGRIFEPKSGDPMLCPCCKQGFSQVVSVERSEVLDRAYVIELLTIPPAGHKGTAIRGREIGAKKSWVHEHARVID